MEGVAYVGDDGVSKHGDAPESHAFAATVERRQKRLLFYRWFVGGVIALNFALFIVMAWIVLTSRSQMNSTFIKTVQATQAAKELQYQDDITSLLAKLTAFTMDKTAYNRYITAVAARKAALDNLISLDSSLGSTFQAATLTDYQTQAQVDAQAMAFAPFCIDSNNWDQCIKMIQAYAGIVSVATIYPQLTSGATINFTIPKYAPLASYANARSAILTRVTSLLAGVSSLQSDETDQVDALSAASIVVVAVALGYVVLSSVATGRLEWEKIRQLKAMTHQMDKDMAREYKLMMEDMRGAFYERLKVLENEYKFDIKRHLYFPQASETFARLREAVTGQMTQVKRLSSQLKDAQINEAAENLNGVANQLKDHQLRVLHTTDETRDGLLTKWKQFQESHRNKEMSKLAGILQQILTNSHVRRGVFFLRCAVFEDSPHRAVQRLLTSWEHNVVASAFSQWLLEAHCEENLQFLRAVGDYENAPREERPARSFDIYTKFVGSECDAEVNLDSSSKLLLDIFFDEKAAARQEKKGPLRLGLNDKILTMDDVDNGTVFSQAKACILHLLATDSYPRFLSSKHGQELRQDLHVVEALLPEMLAPLHQFNSASEELVTQYALRAVRAGQFEVAQQCWSEGTRLFAFSSSQSFMSKMLIPLANGATPQPSVPPLLSIPIPPVPQPLPPPSQSPVVSATSTPIGASVTSLNSPPPPTVRGPGPSSRVPEDKRSPPSETKTVDDSRPPSANGGVRRVSEVRTIEVRPSSAAGGNPVVTVNGEALPPSPSLAPNNGGSGAETPVNEHRRSGSLVMIDVNSTIGVPNGSMVAPATTTSIASANSDEQMNPNGGSRARTPFYDGEDRLLNFHLAQELGFLTQCQADWLAVRNLELADLNAAEQKISALLQRMDSEKERWIRTTVDEVYNWQPEHDSSAQTIYESPVVVPHLVRVECIRRLEELIAAARGAQQDMERRLQMNQPWIVPTLLPGGPQQGAAPNGTVHFHNEDGTEQVVPMSPPGGASQGNTTALQMMSASHTNVLDAGDAQQPSGHVVVDITAVQQSGPVGGHISPIPEETGSRSNTTTHLSATTSMNAGVVNGLMVPGAGGPGDLLSARGATAPPPHPLGNHHLATDLHSPTSPNPSAAAAISAARLRAAESRTGLQHSSPPISPTPQMTLTAAPAPKSNSRPTSSQAKSAVAALIAGTANKDDDRHSGRAGANGVAADGSNGNSHGVTDLPLASIDASVTAAAAATAPITGDRPLSAKGSGRGRPAPISTTGGLPTSGMNPGSARGNGNTSARGSINGISATTPKNGAGPSPKSPPRATESLTMHLSHHADDDDITPVPPPADPTTVPGTLNHDNGNGSDSKQPVTSS